MINIHNFESHDSSGVAFFSSRMGRKEQHLCPKAVTGECSAMQAQRMLGFGFLVLFVVCFSFLPMFKSSLPVLVQDFPTLFRQSLGQFSNG